MYAEGERLLKPFVPSLGLLVPVACGPWQRRMVAALQHVPMEPLLLRIDAVSDSRTAAFRAYTVLDRLLSGVGPGAAMAGEFPDVGPSHALTGMGWPEALVRLAREHALDVLVVPGHLEMPREVVAAFPCGVLRLEGVDFATGEAVEAFASMVNGWTTWEPRLVWQRAGQADRVLYRSPSAVFPLSFWHTAEPAKAKAAHFPARVLAMLRDKGIAAWEDRAEPWEPTPVPAVPDGPAMAGVLPRLLGRQLVGACRNLVSRPQWFLALRRGGGDPFDAAGYEPLYPSPEHGWADPFPVVHEGRIYLFLEDIDMASGRGSIAVMAGRDDGGFDAPRTVLSKPYHLSYPFVFAWEGAMYMVPESSSANAVTLYRATRFPDVWEPVSTLLADVRAVDATLWPHDGAWWLFVNLRVPGGSSWDELFVYRADTPLGPFTPHPANPVVSDVRRARPAGRLFRRDGRLLRPAQDCSGHYGRALTLCEIETLDMETYRERVVARHKAGVLPASDSLHTYNAVPGLEVVDGRRYIPRFRLPWGKR